MNSDGGGSDTPFSETETTVFTRGAFGDVAKLVGACHIPTKQSGMIKKRLTGDEPHLLILTGTKTFDSRAEAVR